MTKQGENISGKGKSLCTGDGWCATVELEKHDERRRRDKRWYLEVTYEWLGAPEVKDLRI